MSSVDEPAGPEEPVAGPARPEEPPRPDRRPELRIGDRDREEAVAHLGNAFGEGRLDLAEYDERVALAYSAKTASDLLHLTADLPLATRDPSAVAAKPPGSATARPRTRRPARASAAEVHAGLPRTLRAAWTAWAAAVSINLVIWLIVSLTSGQLIYFWPIWVAGPWGVMLLFSTLAYRGASGSRRD